MKRFAPTLTLLIALALPLIARAQTCSLSPNSDIICTEPDGATHTINTGLGDQSTLGLDNSTLGGNTGYSNQGDNNTGAGNSGSGNYGTANSGENSVGQGNSGIGDYGLSNGGNNDIGYKNSQSNMIGVDNYGATGTSYCAASVGSICAPVYTNLEAAGQSVNLGANQNYGANNTGNNNTGIDNTGGSGDTGLGNTGNGEQGVGNSGSPSIGTDNSGNGSVGIGNSGSQSTGAYNQQNGVIGAYDNNPTEAENGVNNSLPAIPGIPSVQIPGLPGVWGVSAPPTPTAPSLPGASYLEGCAQNNLQDDYLSGGNLGMCNGGSGNIGIGNCQNTYNNPGPNYGCSGNTGIDNCQNASNSWGYGTPQCDNNTGIGNCQNAESAYGDTQYGSSWSCDNNTGVNNCANYSTFWGSSCNGNTGWGNCENFASFWDGGDGCAYAQGIDNCYDYSCSYSLFELSYGNDSAGVGNSPGNVGAYNSGYCDYGAFNSGSGYGSPPPSCSGYVVGVGNSGTGWGVGNSGSGGGVGNSSWGSGVCNSGSGNIINEEGYGVNDNCFGTLLQTMVTDIDPQALPVVAQLESLVPELESLIPPASSLSALPDDLLDPYLSTLSTIYQDSISNVNTEIASLPPSLWFVQTLWKDLSPHVPPSTPTDASQASAGVLQ